MSRTLDLLTDSDIHGTPDGYRAGCKTNHCPSLVPCHAVYLRYVGDWSFARRVDAGERAADIIAAEVAEAEAVRARDAAAARDERRRENAKRAVKTRQKTPRPKRAPKPPRDPKPTLVDLHGAEIRRLNGEGVNDAGIAAALGLSVNSVHWVRHNLLGLPAAVPSIGGVTPDRFGEVAELHAQGLDDVQIAARMGVDRLTVWKIRTKKLHLPLIPAPRVTGTPRSESEHLAEVARWHGEGLSDGEIGKRVGISKAWANALRNRLGLPANTTSRRGFTEQPHGSRPRYRSGCRCDECRAANRDAMRHYREAS